MNAWVHGFCAGATIAALLTLLLILVYAVTRTSGTISQAEEEQQRE